MKQNLEYKNYLKEFKLLMNKTASLCYDFWSSLYNYHIQGIENFAELNYIGNQLNKLIKDIEIIFEKLNKIKDNDYEVIKLYEYFSKDILNNNEKYNKYHNILINLVINKKINNNNKEINYSSFDLNLLNESDYLIISVDEENKGIIRNISLSSCSILGYHKDEIIGKNMNILIPEIFHKIHNKTINELCEKSKTKFFDCLVNKMNYKPEFIELYVHAKNKSKYLVPLKLKIYLVQTEENELVYIVEIKKNNSYIGELNDNFIQYNNKSDNICCVLTNNNLNIQTFTSNSMELLKLNSNIINSSIDITSFIKQLNDDFLTNRTLTNKDFLDFEESEIINNEKINAYDSNKSSNQYNLIDKIDKNKMLNIKKLLKTKYSFPNIISWIIEINNKSSILNKSNTKNKKSFIISSGINNDIFNDINNITYENNFLMQVREVYISNKHIGYLFYFKKVEDINKTNNDSSLKSLFKLKTKANIKYLSLNYFNLKENAENDESNFNKYIRNMNYYIYF